MYFSKSIFSTGDGNLINDRGLRNRKTNCPSGSEEWIDETSSQSSNDSDNDSDSSPICVADFAESVRDDKAPLSSFSTVEGTENVSPFVPKHLFLNFIRFLCEGTRDRLLLPILCVLFMLQTYPVVLYKALAQIVQDLIKFRFKASSIQKNNKPLKNYKDYKNTAHYSAQLVFQSIFEDRSKFETIVNELLTEAGMIAGRDGKVEWRDEVPSEHFDEDNSRISGDHYVGKGSNFKIDGRHFADYRVGLAMFEKRATPEDPRETTVMQAHLPGRAWDGTSCFNFVKEVVSRYNDEEPNHNVFLADKMISMSKSSAEVFDNKLSILHFVASVPFSVFTNTLAMQWMRAKHALGHSECKEGNRLFCMLNLSERESADLAKALKARPDGRVSPTAALLYSAVTAYKKETGELPHCVPIQASLQTRAYEPLIKERFFVGDWLIAPLHHIRSAGIKKYTLEHAQKAYSTLLEDLATCGGTVKRAFYARVFGVVKGGAATFEKAKTYADNNALCDSLFFNNYGVRTVHEKSKCVSFNWSGAGKLNCNCILLNKRICIVFASQTLPLERLERIRDCAAQELAALSQESGC